MLTPCKVADLVRASCEDGRDFIRTAVSKAMEIPFSPYSGPRISRVKQKQRRREAQAQQSKEHLTSTDTPIPSARNMVTQFVMNLPDSALEFLDAFRGILYAPDVTSRYPAMPMIHCYCFTRELEPDKARMDIIQVSRYCPGWMDLTGSCIYQRAEIRLGHKIEESVSIHLVRSVAPNKDMYCISFRLPRDVAFGC